MEGSIWCYRCRCCLTQLFVHFRYYLSLMILWSCQIGLQRVLLIQHEKHLISSVGVKFRIGYYREWLERFRYLRLEDDPSSETRNLYKTGFVYSRWKEEHVGRYSDVATCNDIFYVVVRYGRDTLDKIVVWKRVIEGPGNSAGLKKQGIGASRTVSTTLSFCVISRATADKNQNSFPNAYVLPQTAISSFDLPPLEEVSSAVSSAVNTFTAGLSHCPSPVRGFPA